jgi:hypothetical protein
MQGMIDVSDPRDLDPFRYPPLRELRRVQVRSVCLGSFIPWDPKKQAELISRELGWQGDLVEGVPPQYGYEKIECFMQGVRDYLRYLKRGYGRTAHLASLDIRNGRLDREQGLALVEQFDGKRPASLDLFLEYAGISEAEFHEIALSHSVSPWAIEPEDVEPGEPLPDMPAWDPASRRLRLPLTNPLRRSA